MSWLDIAKAAGVAAAVLILDVLVALVVVFVWAVIAAPGHSRAYYATAGIPVALWSTRIAGTALVAGAAWLSARRRPERSALLFGAAIVGFYAFFDGASIGFKGFLTLSTALTMGLKLAAALLGAAAARSTAAIRPA